MNSLSCLLWFTAQKNILINMSLPQNPQYLGKCTERMTDLQRYTQPEGQQIFTKQITDGK